MLSSLPNYHVIRQLPGGGMADLYVARGPDNQRVVLRVLQEAYRKDRAAAKGFLQSAKILRKMNHPNVVKLLDSGNSKRGPFMVLEYIEGSTLRDLIVQRSPFLLDNSLSFIRQMAQALFYVHHTGYLHLDLKPENHLVSDDGHVVLLDFDLAIPRKSSAVRLRQLPGTRTYLAPETLTDKLVDERSDIFGFGLTCYEMLTHHKAFPARTPEELIQLQADLEVPATPMNRHVTQIPASLERVIFKCLAKAPDNRYPSMSLVLKDLEAII